MNAIKPKRLSWWSHPALYLIISGFGLFYSTMWTLLLLRMKWTLESMIEPDPTLASSPEHSWLFTWTNPWISLALGLLIGLLTAGVMVVVLCRNRQFCAEVAVLTRAHKYRWSIMWRSFLCTSPVIVMHFAIVGLAQIRTINQTVLWASYIPLGLLYFEQKKIHRAAKSMLEAQAGQADNLDDK